MRTFEPRLYTLYVSLGQSRDINGTAKQKEKKEQINFRRTSVCIEIIGFAGLPHDVNSHFIST